MAEVQSGYRRVPGAEQGVLRAIRQRVYRIRYDVVDLGRRYAGRWKLALLLLVIQTSTLVFVWWQTHAGSSFKTVAVVGVGLFAANALAMVELNLRRNDVVSQAK